MILDSHALMSVSQDLFSVMLGFQVAVCPDNVVGAGSSLTSEIRIVGDRVWRLEVSCPYITASVIAARIFRLPPAELDDDLLLDALGEVANILSGNLKGMLDGEYSLTLPRTRVGSPSTADEATTGDVGLALLCDDLFLRLNLCEESTESLLSAVHHQGTPALGLPAGAPRQSVM